MNAKAKSLPVFVAGSRGLVGSAIVRKLKADGFQNLLTPTRSELNLLDQQAVKKFFQQNKIHQGYFAAAKVGGIYANDKYSADFMYENLVLATNVIHEAAQSGVEKLLFLGSSCIYPKLAPQPLKEESLLTGLLEYTNEGYALAKIAGLKLCEMYRKQYGKNFISAMPTNLYGPHDNFHPENSHVLPGLLRRFHEAKVKNDPVVTVWGSGKPMREFLHVEDLADAVVFLMDRYNEKDTINVGTGKDCTILELAESIKQVTGYKGDLVFDASKPDGTMRKVLDTSKINNLGWKPRYSLMDGLRSTYQWCLENRTFNAV